MKPTKVMKAQLEEAVSAVNNNQMSCVEAMKLVKISRVHITNMKQLVFGRQHD